VISSPHGDYIHGRGVLGHGGIQDEQVPRRVEALAGNKLIGAATGEQHTAVWSDVGELFTFGRGAEGKLGRNLARKHSFWLGEKPTRGDGDNGRLGHGGTQGEYVPRLVEALVGKKVVGAAAGAQHTAVWTEAG
jgi:alpha-tubulin suppressor-like RCC1 family protein